MRYAAALSILLAVPVPPAIAQAPAVSRAELPIPEECGISQLEGMRRNPTPAELRCRFGAQGPGKFGLLSYLDVPVYRPATPLPGTHVVGVPGMPRPRPGESYEHWEWRVLRTPFAPEVHRVHRDLALLDPVFLELILRFERELARQGIRARRRETWRSPERQGYVFQQGRSRPGPIATTTLTSWHCRVDRDGRAAARAVDYDVPSSQLPRFHQVATELGLHGYGADSHDPGHVFLPDADAASGLELAVLRLLPRVAHVTLATGRPDDEPRLPGAREHWQRRSSEFVRHPFLPFPDERPAGRSAPTIRSE